MPAPPPAFPTKTCFSSFENSFADNSAIKIVLCLPLFTDNTTFNLPVIASGPFVIASGAVPFAKAKRGTRAGGVLDRRS
jgi:hypothetical protein